MDWNQVRQTPQQNGWDSIRNFVSSAGSALGTPIVKSLANIGALGANTLGNVQMALNKPESALKSYDRALAARQYAGTEGSFDQGFKSGAGTLVKGGLSALQTALTASGLKYITPAKLATTGLIGGGFSKVMGGDFSTGAGQAVGSLPQILGFVGATNPILAKYLPKNSQIPDRILGAGGNVIQGIGMDLARGTPTTPLGVGIDLVTGAMGGTSQFDMPNVKGLNPDVFVSDKNILNEAKQQLRTGIELDPFSKLGKDLDNMYKNYGLASYPDWNKLSIEERVNVLDDRVSEMAKQWGNNVKMGIVDDKPIKTGTNKTGIEKALDKSYNFNETGNYVTYKKGNTKIEFGRETLADGDEALFLQDIYTEPTAQGKGEASKILKEITDYADKNDETIALRASIGGHDNIRSGLTQEQLIKWYEKNGFVKSPNASNFGQDDIFMVRNPKAISPIKTGGEINLNIKTASGKNKQIQIYKNITSEQANSINKSYPEGMLKRGENPLRAVVDKDSNAYTWRALDATHDSVIAALKEKGVVADINTNPNRAFQDKIFGRILPGNTQPIKTGVKK
jgi:GNAT superfamily N-acetyltransferase